MIPATCPRCGTAVLRPGDLCDVCAALPRNEAPKASLELHPQPAPAYERSRYEPEPDEEC